ncbi:MAG: hypothetical protein KatS3mg082_1042 [Nitrospiraceae bacterium]|nr:MAG: hypothetical protein KatS3mg082_1042 [Nitrospiraceae bacterium]
MRPGGGNRSVNVALSRTAGSAFTRPKQLGPDHAHAVLTDLVHQVPLQFPPLVADLGEAGRNDDERPHPARRAVVHHRQHRVARDHDHGEVDRFGECPDRGKDGQTGQLGRMRIDGIQTAGEAAGAQRVEQPGIRRSGGRARRRRPPRPAVGRTAAATRRSRGDPAFRSGARWPPSERVRVRPRCRPPARRSCMSKPDSRNTSRIARLSAWVTAHSRRKPWRIASKANRSSSSVPSPLP